MVAIQKIWMNEFVFFHCCKSLVHIAGRRGGGGDGGQERESRDRKEKEKRRIGGG